MFVLFLDAASIRAAPHPLSCPNVPVLESLFPTSTSFSECPLVTTLFVHFVTRAKSASSRRHRHVLLLKMRASIVVSPEATILCLSSHI